jgi:1-acyl-sn-glycerol-3-phosphate acyltransferase
MWLKLRSVLFYLGVIPVTIFFGLVGILILPLPRRWRYFVITRWSVFTLFWLAVTCGLRWRVRYEQPLPATPCVILCKHQSAWETITLQMIFPPQSQVLKKELLHLPFFGWGLASLNPIAIDRKAGARALRHLLSAGKQRLQQGWWVLIFPEGTRVPPGQRGRYSSGGAALALQAKCPVVPVAHNAGVFWPRNAMRKEPGTIDVVVGAPIATEGRSAAEVSAEAEAWIEARCAELPATPLAREP